MLLSLVIPTKDRYNYLFVLLEKVIEFKRKDLEIIVEDNSKDNREMIDWLEENSVDYLKYAYNPDYGISAVENCDNAFERTTGHYVCFIGDDDGITNNLFPFLKWLKNNNYDAATFDKGTYLWPDLTHKYLKTKVAGRLSFNNSMAYSYKEKDPSKELKKLLYKGGQDIHEMPKAYHAVVSNRVLHKLKEKCGTFFPGPVPDMTNAVGIVPFVDKYIFTNAPLVISGNAGKSMAGKGALKKHLGEIKDQPSLPSNSSDNWSHNIPKFWSGPTIWAEGLFKGLEASGNSEMKRFFNWPYFYAFTLVFTKGFSDRIYKSIRQNYPWYKRGLILVSYIKVYMMRVRPFLSNYFGIGSNEKYTTNSDSIKKAIDCIDEHIDKAEKFWKS